MVPAAPTHALINHARMRTCVVCAHTFGSVLLFVLLSFTLLSSCWLRCPAFSQPPTSEMFYGASAFNQELCWDVDGVDTTDMFVGSPGSIGCA